MPVRRLSYQQPAARTPEETRSLLVAGEARQLTEALIGLTLSDPDMHSVFTILTLPEVINHIDPGVRGAAVLCLGHLARIHREIPIEPTVTIIKEALVDEHPWVRERAETAESDLQTFAPEVASKIRSTG